MPISWYPSVMVLAAESKSIPHCITIAKAAIARVYHLEWLIKEEPSADGESAGVNQAENQSHEPQQTPPNKPKDKNNGGGTALQSVPPSRKKTQSKPQQQEVKSDGQA